MPDPVASLPGLGPKTAAWLSEVGVNTADDLRALGAVAAYVRLKREFPDRVSLNALHSAVTGVPWDKIAADEKQSLLKALRNFRDK